MNIELIKFSTLMVINAPYFWPAMGFTSAISMFIGAYIYKDRIGEAKKGIFLITSYIFMLVWVNFIRITNTLSHTKTSSNIANAYNGLITIFLITIFWIFGIVFGISVLKIRKYINKIKSSQ